MTGTQTQTMRSAMGVALVGLVVAGAACQEDFDPPTLVTELRVLGIAAEPPDLAPGESTELSALVANPTDDPVRYSWEWCPLSAGPDRGYECLTEGVDLPETALELFDLGSEPTALLAYPFDGQTLQDICFQILDEIDSLPDFVELPDCQLGVEVFVRLTVRTGLLDKVAIKRLFLWFIDEPDVAQRNRNPDIANVETGGVPIDADQVLRVAPGGQIRWRVDVAGTQMEIFEPRDAAQASGGIQREELLFSWFSTEGDWDRQRTFADGVEFTLDAAGRNRLDLPTINERPRIDVYFVLRDGRGGIDWETRRLEVAEPSGAPEEATGDQP